MEMPQVPLTVEQTFGAIEPQPVADQAEGLMPNVVYLPHRLALRAGWPSNPQGISYLAYEQATYPFGGDMPAYWVDPDPTAPAAYPAVSLEAVTYSQRPWNLPQGETAAIGGVYQPRPMEDAVDQLRNIALPSSGTDPIGETIPASDPNCRYYRIPAASTSRTVNILSTEAIDELIARARSEGRLVPVEVENGNGSRWAWMSRYKNTARQQPQMTCPTGSLALMQLARTFPERNITLVDVGQVMWRFHHRDASGCCRLLSFGLQVSHRAAAYDIVSASGGWEDNRQGWDSSFAAARRQYQATGTVGLGKGRRYADLPPVEGAPGWRVELSEQESQMVNESRKMCALFALHWRRASDFSLMTSYDPNAKLACPHAAWGMPCYGPRPTHPANVRRPDQLFISPTVGQQRAQDKKGVPPYGMSPSAFEAAPPEKRPKGDDAGTSGT